MAKRTTNNSIDDAEALALVMEMMAIPGRSGEESAIMDFIRGKLLGAGGGGFVLLFVPPSQQERARAALKNLINVPFHFEFSGSQIIFFEPERDYSAEEKLRASQEFNFLGEATNLSPIVRARI